MAYKFWGHNGETENIANPHTFSFKQSLHQIFILPYKTFSMDDISTQIRSRRQFSILPMYIYMQGNSLTSGSWKNSMPWTLSIPCRVVKLLNKRLTYKVLSTSCVHKWSNFLYNYFYQVSKPAGVEERSAADTLKWHIFIKVAFTGDCIPRWWRCLLFQQEKNFRADIA